MSSALPRVITGQFCQALCFSEVVLLYADGSYSRAPGEVGYWYWGIGFELMDTWLHSFYCFLSEEAESNSSR
jgi:hypothetical protein